MAIAVAAATSGVRRRRRNRANRRSQNQHQQDPTRRRLAAMSHLVGEQGRKSNILFTHSMDPYGISLINECRSLHNYTSAYDKHDTVLTRSILPPDNANFSFLPYQISSEDWREGSTQKMPSPFGEINIKTSVFYPPSFLRIFPKAEFIKMMDHLHTSLKDFKNAEGERKRATFCSRFCFSTSDQNKRLRAHCSHILKEQINTHPLFVTKNTHLQYLFCGGLEGLLLQVSPWIGDRNDKNEAWDGKIPFLCSIASMPEGDEGEEGKEGGENEAPAPAEGVLVPDNTIFDSGCMCDPPALDPAALNTRTCSYSPYVVHE